MFSSIASSSRFSCSLGGSGSIFPTLKWTSNRFLEQQSSLLSHHQQNYTLRKCSTLFYATSYFRACSVPVKVPSLHSTTNAIKHCDSFLKGGRRNTQSFSDSSRRDTDEILDQSGTDEEKYISKETDNSEGNANHANKASQRQTSKGKRHTMRQMKGSTDMRRATNDEDLFAGAEEHPKSFSTSDINSSSSLPLHRFAFNGAPISTDLELKQNDEKTLKTQSFADPSIMKWPSVLSSTSEHTLDLFSHHLFDPSLSWPCYIIQRDNLNTVKYSSIDRKHLKHVLGLRTRDVQILVSLNNYPIILPRDSCIIVDIKNLQCIIMPEKVLVLEKAQPSLQFMVDFLDPEQNTRDLSEFIAMELKHLDNDQPFELNVLESILRFVILRAERTYGHFHNTLEKIFNDPGTMPSEERMHNMLVTKQSMSRFLTYLTDCHQCIDSLLSSDEDMTRLYITERLEGRFRPTQEHEEVELLLEAYYAQIEDLMNRVKQLIRDIQSTQDYLNICLDSQRNRMIEFELRLVIGSFVVSMATLIAGVFGMNLLSGVEADPSMFWYVTGGTFVGCACVLVVLVGVAKKKGLFESVVSFLKIRKRKFAIGRQSLPHEHSSVGLRPNDPKRKR